MKTIFLFWVLSFSSVPAFAAEEICPQGSGKTALVVIDMQPYFMKRVGTDATPENAAKIKQALAAQTEAINEAKKANIPIIMMEYDGYGDTDPSLKETVANYRNTKFFKKTSDGMFVNYNKYRKELIEYMKQNKIGNLVVTGANGGSCVLLSIKNALRGNCSVLAYNKGIADFNYKEFMYPYTGQYSDIKPNCSNCTFQETSQIEDVSEFMSRGSYSNGTTIMSELEGRK